MSLDVLPSSLAAHARAVLRLGPRAVRVFWNDGSVSLVTEDASGARWIDHEPAGGAEPARFGPVAAGAASTVFASTGAATAARDPNAIAAPIAGIVRACAAAAGQSVRGGDVLCVVEAMKMEMSLVAPRDGVVRAVLTSVGAVVERGAVLVTLA